VDIHAVHMVLLPVDGGPAESRSLAIGTLAPTRGVNKRTALFLRFFTFSPPLCVGHYYYSSTLFALRVDFSLFFRIPFPP
jgi:hypothetical protein